jgi:hypothetical protein
MAGEAGVLTAQPVVAWEETGGSSSGAKLVPYTAESLHAFRAAVLPWMTALARRRPGVSAGRVYLAASPVVRRTRQLQGGLAIGLPSQAAYIGADLVRDLEALMAVPDPGGEQDVASWRLDTLAALVRCHDLAVMSVWSPTFLLELMDGLCANPGPVLDSLESSGDRRSAGRLRQALVAGTVDTRALWPALDTISMWTDGASALYAASVVQYFPETHVDAKGILATEGPITVRLDDDGDCVPALTSGFIEFLDAEGHSHAADRLDVGARYRVLLTTPGGFYRYDLGDEVQCTGRFLAAPRLRFVGRGGLVSDLVGEKLTESLAAAAVASLPAAGCLVPATLPYPHYELWVDGEDCGSAGHLAAVVDNLLRRNPQYDYARRLGQLRPPRTVYRPGFTRQRIHALEAAGARPADIKPLALIIAPASTPKRTVQETLP